MKTNIKITRIVTAIFAATLATGVYAKGGTAKPPNKGAVSPYTVGTVITPNLPLSHWAAVHQFDVTGFIEGATVSGTGGTIKVNGITITIPANSIIQMPANTLSWPAVVALGDATHPSLLLKDQPINNPGFEAHVVGNIVNGEYIAGLIYLSQQSASIGNGVITGINYADGSLTVTDGATPPNTLRIQINDPVITDPSDPANGTGRFSIGQSPDDRFSVDNANPTIHAATGYPMCIPRSADDARCPQKNRPLASSGCRNFNAAGLTVPFSATNPFSLPASGDLTAPPATQTYCSQFVMKAPSTAQPVIINVNGTPVTLFTPNASNTASATDPDVTKQAPFEIGDYINYSGTLIHDSRGNFLSAHTIEANVAIYTQPYTQPSYLAIGEFGLGTADPLLTAVNGVGQETQDRIFLEAETTDVKTPVDVLLVDSFAFPTTLLPAGEPSLDQFGHSRWVTPYEMTGECNPAAFPSGLPAYCFGSSGGITTQNAGANPTRARIRATRAVTGILSSPSRTVRVMARSLCQLDGSVNTNLTSVDSTYLGGNGWGNRTYNQHALDVCLANSTPVANGLKAGQYYAPVFEFIFPENVTAGNLIVPNDFWHLPFLSLPNGDSLSGGAAALSSTPW